MPVSRNGDIWPAGLNGGGVQIQSVLTRSRGVPDNPLNGPTSGQALSLAGSDVVPPTVNYLWYILGVFIVLVLIKFAIEHEKSGVQPAFVGISVYNWLATGLMVVLFLIVSKAILNKFYVKGLTELFNAA